MFCFSEIKKKKPCNYRKHIYRQMLKTNYKDMDRGLFSIFAPVGVRDCDFTKDNVSTHETAWLIFAISSRSYTYTASRRQTYETQGKIKLMQFYEIKNELSNAERCENPLCGEFYCLSYLRSFNPLRPRIRALLALIGYLDENPMAG